MIFASFPLRGPTIPDELRTDASDAVLRITWRHACKYMTDEEKLAACRVKSRDRRVLVGACPKGGRRRVETGAGRPNEEHRDRVLQRLKHRVILRGIGRRVQRYLHADKGGVGHSGAVGQPALGLARVDEVLAAVDLFVRGLNRPRHGRICRGPESAADLAVDGHRDQRRAIAVVHVGPQAERLVSAAPAARLRPAFERAVQVAWQLCQVHPAAYRSGPGDLAGEGLCKLARQTLHVQRVAVRQHVVCFEQIKIRLVC